MADKKQPGLKQKAGKAGIILLWLCIWQLAVLKMNNAILLVGPLEVIARLCADVGTLSFWQTVAASFSRISAGFLSAFVLGSLFGVLSYKLPLVKAFLAPVIQVMKSVPVASFVVILLICFGASHLSVWTSFLVVFPNLYFQMQEGMRALKMEHKEMAKVYEMSLWNRSWYLYRPAIEPFIRSGSKTAMGMAWKTGVAAEVIGLTSFSIGERIYMSKIYLDTAGVLSWTFVCVALSILAEKLFFYLLKLFFGWKVPMLMKKSSPLSNSNEQKREAEGIKLTQISKSFGEQQVITKQNFYFEKGGVYACMAPSGMGKTTLLRILSGLDGPDSGSMINIPSHIGMVFQENTQIEQLSARENIELVCGKKPAKEWQTLFGELGLLPEDLDKKIAEFSGGMERRAELLKCMMSKGELLLLDEPFNGLDVENRERAYAFLTKYRGKRTLIFTTHKMEEAEKLNAEIFGL